MAEFTDILNRITLRSITTYLLYGAEPVSEITDSFETRILTSYTELFTKLKARYPDADKTNEILYNMIADFALVHSDVFLQTGALLGFQLYKVFEQKYHDCPISDLNKTIQKYNGSTLQPKKEETNMDELLNILLEGRMNDALTKILASDETYQNIMKEYNLEIEQMENLLLTPEQNQSLDSLLSCNNAISAVYGAAAYRLGFHDAKIMLSQS